MRSFVTALSLITATAAFGQTWQQLAPVPSPGRDDAVAFAIGAFGYLVTGNHGGFSESNKLWRYDPQANVWTERAPFPGIPRQYAGAFVLDGKAYVLMGISENGIPLNDVWQYDPAGDAWTQLNDFPGEARWSLFAFSTIRGSYVGTGSTLTGLLSDCWKYVPVNDSWIRLADFPGGQRRETVSFAIGEKGFAGLGYAGFGGSDFRADIYCLNELNGQWSQLPDFPGGGRAYANAVGTGSFGFVGTGQDETDAFFSDCYVFDPVTQLWQELQSFPLSCRGMSGFAIADTPYFLTGIDENYIRFSDLWKLNEAPKAAQPWSFYPNPASGHFVVKAPEGSTVKLFSADGKCIREMMIGQQQAAWFEAVSPGAYQLRITTGDEVFSGTIVVL